MNNTKRKNTAAVFLVKLLLFYLPAALIMAIFVYCLWFVFFG